MDKRQIKAFSEAYDKLYDLQSNYNKLDFTNMLKSLEIEVESLGYKFKLSAKDKWKCVLK